MYLTTTSSECVCVKSIFLVLLCKRYYEETDSTLKSNHIEQKLSHSFHINQVGISSQFIKVNLVVNPSFGEVETWCEPLRLLGSIFNLCLWGTAETHFQLNTGIT